MNLKVHSYSVTMAAERVTIWHMATRKRLDIAEIGRRIAQRRDDLGLDQQELADAAKVSRPYISRLERGIVPNPKLMDLEQVADAPDWSIMDLTTTPDQGGPTAALRREAQAMLGMDNGEIIEAVVQKVASRPDLDRQIVLKVIADLVETFPPISTDRPS